MKWWFAMLFADYLDIVCMYGELGNNEHTDMQLIFHDPPNPSVFVTAPKLGGTGLNITTANHAFITQKFRVLTEQCPAFARVV
jgi:hypothetical protein